MHKVNSFSEIILFNLLLWTKKKLKNIREFQFVQNVGMTRRHKYIFSWHQCDLSVRHTTTTIKIIIINKTISSYHSFFFSKCLVFTYPCTSIHMMMTIIKSGAIIPIFLLLYIFYFLRDIDNNKRMLYILSHIYFDF